jgi:hypothetical protein
VLPIGINFGRIAQNCVQPETSVQKGKKNVKIRLLNRNFFAAEEPETEPETEI